MGEHYVLAEALEAFHARKTTDLDTLLRRYNTPGGMTVGKNGIHIIFCLDESGSMSGHPWAELLSAFNVFWQQSAAEPGPPMYASVIQFGSSARITEQMIPLQG